MVDILVSFCLVVPLSVRASEFFFFHAEGRREKRLYVKNTSTVQNLTVNENELITSTVQWGEKKIPWPRIDSRYPGLGNGNQIPVLLHGKLHRQRNLAGYRSWGQKELDMTEHKHTQAGRTCSNSCFLGTVTGLYYGQKQKFTGLTISSNSLFFFFCVLWTYSLQVYPESLNENCLSFLSLSLVPSLPSFPLVVGAVIVSS